MDPIFNKFGETVGWKNSNIIYDMKIRYRAYIHDNVVFSKNNDYLGYFNKLIFRDTIGCSVAFMDGARGGPILPIHVIPPVPPIPPIPPITLIPPIPPVPPIDRLAWSNLEWNDYLR